MPQWGLTTEMQQTAPWGLPARWLAPSKVITDPVHGDVFTTVLEQAIIDTGPMQRLRRVRQLHLTHEVYPGATHSRFAHSLGSMRVVQDLLDHVLEQRFGHHAVPDLFAEWDPSSPTFRPRNEEAIENVADLDPARRDEGNARRDAIRRRAFLRDVSQATVLARLGALLHDVCHLPFGHSVEDDLRLLEAHDRNAVRFGELWDELLADIGARLDRDGRASWIDDLACIREGGGLYQDLRPLILSKERDKGQEDGDDVVAPAVGRYPFVADMVGNTICADLLDYLRRDHEATGLPISLGHRFMAAFYVTPTDSGAFGARMALLLHREGRERVDVTTEVLKHLRYRYELSERVLVHHAKLAADAMLGLMLEHVYEAARDHPSDMPTLRRRSRLAAIGTTTASRANRVKPERRFLEDLLLTFSDDGILEWLAEHDQHPRLGSAAGLARALLDRDLFRPVANAAGAFAAEDMHRRWGQRADRRALEASAARHARITEADQIIIWLPPPGMRLKLAKVLVDHGKGLAKFKDYSALGQDIYEAHRRLWTISLFANRSVTPQQRIAVAAHLARSVGVCWDRYERVLGPVPATWPARLAAMQAIGAERADDDVERLLDLATPDQLAARGAGGDELDHDQLREAFAATADEHGIPRRGAQDVGSGESLPGV